MARISIPATVLAVLLLLPAACDTVTPRDDAGFKSEYLVARNALEGGKYAQAVKLYAALLDRSGPLSPRVRLEYAHSLLRDNQFDEALQQARIVAENQTGTGRLAAMAVVGTAEHEIALIALEKGKSGAAVKKRLLAARAAFDEVLKAGKTMDPIGAIAARRSEVNQQLASL